MNKRKILKSNSLKSNQIILSAMQKRRSLAYSAIAKVCNLEIKLKVVK